MGVCALYDEHIIGSIGCVITDGPVFQTQIIIVCAKLANGVSAGQANTDGLSVTYKLQAVLICSIIISVPVAPGSVVRFCCGEVDTATAGTVYTGLQYANIIGNRQSGLSGREFQGAVVVIDVSLTDIHHAAGSRMLKTALDDQVILILQRQHLTADGMIFGFQVIIGSCKLDQGSIAGHTYADSLTAANKLNHIGTDRRILDTPIILHEISIVFGHCGINTTIAPAVTTALQGTGRNNRAVIFGLQVIAVHSLHQILQYIRAGIAIVLSGSIGQRTVGNRQRTVNNNGNDLIQILGIDIAHFYIVHTVLCNRCASCVTDLKFVGLYITADGKVETHCGLRLEDQ